MDAYFYGMNIQTAISELLYLHDCVIIPGFGGFVTRYQPATIHPTQHQFTAPCKAILFNKSLNANDGLLADHIARRSGKSFNEAVAFIENEVKEFDRLLASGKRVLLTNVGELFLDVEKSIQFSPDPSSNYLLDSYGLVEFQSAAIRRYEDYSKVVQMPVAVESVRKNRNVKRILIAASLLPFVALMSYLPFNPDLANQSLSNLNPFAGVDGGKSLYTPRTHEVKEINLKDVTFNHTLPVNTSEADAEVKADVVVPAVTTDVVKTEVSQAVQPRSYKFLLIAGCFQSHENALKFVSELTSKGLQASLAGQTPNGLYRVSCGMFNDRNEAVASQRILGQQNTSAWILAN